MDDVEPVDDADPQPPKRRFLVIRLWYFCFVGIAVDEDVVVDDDEVEDEIRSNSIIAS